MENDVVTRARGCISQLSTIVAASIPPSPPATPLTPADINNKVPTLEEATTLSGAIIVELRTEIQATDDPKRLEELLTVNDELLASLKQIPSFIDGGIGNGSGGGDAGKRPKLVLQGLGLSFDNNDAKAEANGNIPAPTPGERETRTDDDPGIPDADTIVSSEGLNGIAESASQVPAAARGDDEGGDTTPTTPRIDKGKGRAEPEEEEPEKVLSPSYELGEEDEEDEEGVEYTIPEEIAALMPSPTERYVIGAFRVCTDDN